MGGTLTFLTPGTWLPHCENGGREPLPLVKTELTGKTVYAYNHEPRTHIEKTKNGCLHLKTMPGLYYSLGRQSFVLIHEAKVVNYLILCQCLYLVK